MIYLVRQRRRMAATVLALSLLSGMAVTQAGCDSNKIREGAKAAVAIQTAVDVAIDSTDKLLDDKIITPAKAKVIVPAIKKVHDANGAFIEIGSKMKADTGSNRCILASQLGTVVDALAALKDAGVLGIKSANGQLVFDLLISSVKSDIQIIAALIGDCAVPAAVKASHI